MPRQGRCGQNGQFRETSMPLIIIMPSNAMPYSGPQWFLVFADPRGEPTRQFFSLGDGQAAFDFPYISVYVAIPIEDLEEDVGGGNLLIVLDWPASWGPGGMLDFGGDAAFIVVRDHLPIVEHHFVMPAKGVANARSDVANRNVVAKAHNDLNCHKILCCSTAVLPTQTP